MAQTFRDHLLAGAIDHPGDVVEAHRPVPQMPEDRPRPLAAENAHALLDRTGLPAGLGHRAPATLVLFNTRLHRLSPGYK